MLVVPSRKALILKAETPEFIYSCIPTAKPFPYKGRELVYVPHELDESKVLRNLGFRPPSPIEFYYDYPLKDGKHPPYAHQRKTCDFLTMHPRCAVLNQPRCVDSETEYLTPTGWKKITDYTPGGLVGQYNSATKQAEFVVPEAYHKTPCEQMVKFKTRSVDQMLSPGHRVLIRNTVGQEYVRSALEIHEHVQAGKTMTTWGIPVTFGAPNTAGLPLSDAEVRLMVAVIADGHFPSRTTHAVVRLKKARKVARLRDLLGAAGVAHREREDQSESGKGFTVFYFSAPRHEKDFSQWWAASKAQLAIITDEVLHWDGNVTTGRDRFSTFISASADFIQYAFATCGYVTALHKAVRNRRGRTETEYVVQRHKSRYGIIRLVGGGSRRTPSKNTQIVPSTDGFMYCFTVPSTYLVFRRNGHVFVSGNTGKTNSCLWAYDYLRKQGKLRRALIVAPLSTLDPVWATEIFQSFWWLKFAVLHGSREKRIRLLQEDVDVFIVNHHGFEIIRNHLPADIDIVIYDEANVVRNPRTGFYKHMSAYVESRPALWLWLLTGTPTPNEPTDAWALCKLIGAAVPRYGAFRDMVMQKVSTWAWRPRPEAAEVVSRYLQPSILFKRDDCFDLPEIVYETRQCELSPQQKDAFKAMLRSLQADVGGQQITAVSEAAKVQKLLQILCGSVYTDAGETAVLVSDERTAVIREVIEECDEKVIVFVPFTGALRNLAAALSKHFTVEMVNGSVSKSRRDCIFRSFQESADPRVIVADARTMSHGLDLTAATTIIWAGPTNSNDVYEQACARILGPKQKHKPSVVHIEATDVERRIFQRLRDKQSMQGLLLDIIQATGET